MRFKYYLRGAGFGIVFSTLIFIIAMYVKGGIFSDEKAIERALELGYISGDATVASGFTNEDLKNAADNNEPDSDMPFEEGSEEDLADFVVNPNADYDSVLIEEEEKAMSDEDLNTDAVDEAGESDAGSKEETEEESVALLPAGESATIVVESQDGSERVSYKLYQAGLINDADEFNAYLMNNGYDRIIQSGSVTITSGASYEQIAKIITHRN